MMMIYRAIFGNLLSLFFLAGLNVYAADQESTVQKPSGPITLTVQKTAEPVKIDGRLDEKAWKTAPEIPLVWEKIWQRVDGERTSFFKKTGSPVSYAKLLWDDKNLYFACTGKDRDLLATFEERDAELWREDAFELFIRPSSASTRYWEYEWSPKNRVLDIAWGPVDDRDFDRNKGWNGTGESAVLFQGTLNRHDDNDEGWTVEVRIPFSDFAPLLTKAPQPGDVWNGVVLHYSKWMDGNKKQIRTFVSGPVMLADEIESYNRLLFTGPPENR